MSGCSLRKIAERLKSEDKKVQLIYAFNGTGKTRLSREFKELIAPKEFENEELNTIARNKVLYYNAFTEDLFYWDNDLTSDRSPVLKIQPNTFTDWIFQEQGKEFSVIDIFQRYTDNGLTPTFNTETEKKLPQSKARSISITLKRRPYSKVTFSYQRGNNDIKDNIKISKGEESIFIWSVFYSLLEDVIGILNIADLDDRESDQFNELEYVFIDDPVSSLDNNHLIQLAVDLASLIKESKSNIKFIITTHSTVFYNVLYSEIKSKKGYILRRLESGDLELDEKKGDSNTSFSYHLYIKGLIEDAIKNDTIQRYHFMLLRNLYEKTASFLGYQRWGDLLPENKQAYLNRIIQYTSHSTLAHEVVAEPTNPEKNIVKFLLNHLVEQYNFWQERKSDHAN